MWHFSSGKYTCTLLWSIYILWSLILLSVSKPSTFPATTKTGKTSKLLNLHDKQPFRCSSSRMIASSMTTVFPEPVGAETTRLVSDAKASLKTVDWMTLKYGKAARKIWNERLELDTGTATWKKSERKKSYLRKVLKALLTLNLSWLSLANLPICPKLRFYALRLRRTNQSPILKFWTFCGAGETRLHKVH